MVVFSFVMSVFQGCIIPIIHKKKEHREIYSSIKEMNPSKIEWDLTNKDPLNKLLELLEL